MSAFRTAAKAHDHLVAVLKLTDAANVMRLDGVGGPGSATGVQLL